MKKYLIITLLTGAITVSAQDLSTEVVVDRTVAPVENIAVRPVGLTPVTVLPQPAIVELMPRMYNSLSSLTYAYEPLSVFGGSLTPEPSPYKGYLTAAYGPLLTTDLRAGYRFMQSEKLTAGASFNFGSVRYKSFQNPDLNVNRYVKGRVRGYAVWRPDEASTLNVEVHAAHINQATCRWNSIPSTIGGLSASWTSKAGVIHYGASAKGAVDHVDNITQTTYDVAAYGGYEFTGGLRLGIDVNARGMHTGSITNYAVTVGPFLSYKAENIVTRLGVGLEPSGVSNVWHNNSFHVVPQFELQVRVSNSVGISALVSGGTQMQSFEQMRSYSEFLYPNFIYYGQNSYMPVMAEVGAVFGPASGLSLEISGGYASARGRMFLSTEGFSACDVNGWHAAATLRYSSMLISGHAGVDLAPRSGNHAWAASADMADLKCDAALDVTPIPVLTAGLGYEFIKGRGALPTGLTDGKLDADKLQPLGIVSDLNIHAQYRFSEKLSFQGELRNILGRNYCIVYGVPAQQLHGQVGVTYKF